MRDNSNHDRERLLDYIIAAAGSESDTDHSRQGMLEPFIKEMSAAVDAVAKRADDPEFGGAPGLLSIPELWREAAYSVEGVIQTIENYRVLLRFAAQVVRVVRDLPPVDAAKFKLDTLGALSWAVQGAELIELWSALAGSYLVGTYCVDSPVLQQQVKAARAKNWRDGHNLGRGEQLKELLWEAASPHVGELRTAKAIWKRIGEKFRQDYRDRFPRKKSPAKDPTIIVYLNELLVKHGHRPPRTRNLRHRHHPPRPRHLRF